MISHFWIKAVPTAPIDGISTRAALICCACDRVIRMNGGPVSNAICPECMAEAILHWAILKAQTAVDPGMSYGGTDD